MNLKSMKRLNIFGSAIFLLTMTLWTLQGYGEDFLIPRAISCEVLVTGNFDIRMELQSILKDEKIRAAVRELGKRYRSGWREKGVPDELGETILAHSVKVFNAAMIYPIKGQDLDRRRMALMAFFHDIAEFEVKDYTPNDPISKDEKHDLERKAITNLIRGTGRNGQLILDLWEEYTAQETKESQLVMQLDKLDAGIQAFEYEKMGFDVSVFFPYTEERLSDPLLKAVFGDLQKRLSPQQNNYDQYFARLRSEIGGPK